MGRALGSPPTGHLWVRRGATGEQPGRRFAPREWSRDLFPILVVIPIAVVVRLAVLNARSLWFDEIFSITAARLPWSDALRLISRSDPHPPLYYLLLKLWLFLGQDPAVVRGLSVLFGVLAVLPTWALGRALGGHLTPALAVLFLGTSTLAIQASVEARMYALVALIIVTSSWLLWHAVAGRRGWWWAAYAAAMAAGFYAGYLVLLVVPAHVLYVGTNQKRRLSMGPLLISLSVALLVFVPWLSAAAGQLARVPTEGIWRGEVTLTSTLENGLNMLALASFGGYLLGLGGYLVEGGRWSPFQLLVLLPFAVLVGMGKRSRGRGGAGLLLLASWVVPIVLLLAATLASGVYWSRPRLIAIGQPFFALLLAQGISVLALRSRRAAAAVSIGVLALNFLVLGLTTTDPRYNPYDWAGAARYVEAHWRSGDALVFYPHTGRLAFGYYFPLPVETSVTLYPPSWRVPSTRTEWAQSLPPATVLVRGAKRAWLILSTPTPPATAEALVERFGAAYRPIEVLDFRQVWVLLFEKPPR